jgi:tripartite-type tricarboxylate transporter receptor subunit TctC
MARRPAPAIGCAPEDNAMPHTPRRAALALLAAPAVARAQWAPARPIRVIVGFAPGGGTDITTRTLAAKLQAELGQPIVVENRPGASGNLATELVVRAAPDGHTLLMGTIAALAINPALFRSLPFDVQRDLTPVSMSGDVLNLLVCAPEKPFRSVAELIAAARMRPGALSHGSSGVGGSGHLAGALFNRMAGVETAHVPYRGGGALIADILAGQVDFSFATASTTLGAVEGGRLRALAVPGAMRTPLLPGVPAVAETLPGFAVANWNALMGPAGMAAPVVETLNRAMRAALGDAEVRQHLARHGVEATPSSPAELGRFIAEETAKWAPIVRESGASVD